MVCYLTASMTQLAGVVVHDDVLGMVTVKFSCCAAAALVNSCWTMTTMEELDWMATHGADGAAPGSQGASSYFGSCLMVLYSWQSEESLSMCCCHTMSAIRHHMLGHLTVHDGKCDLIMYDSRVQANGSSYQQHVANSVEKWNEWFVKEAIKLKAELKQYVALGQQQCTWRCGYFVVLNGSKLMAQQLKQLHTSVLGAH